MDEHAAGEQQGPAGHGSPSRLRRDGGVQTGRRRRHHDGRQDEVVVVAGPRHPGHVDGRAGRDREDRDRPRRLAEAEARGGAGAESDRSSHHRGQHHDEARHRHAQERGDASDEDREARAVGVRAKRRRRGRGQRVESLRAHQARAPQVLRRVVADREDEPVGRVDPQVGRGHDHRRKGEEAGDREERRLVGPGCAPSGPGADHRPSLCHRRGRSDRPYGLDLPADL